MKTLCIVDPDLLIRRLMRVIFEDSFRIIEAEDGETALGLIWTERPDVVLLETNLPSLSGIEVCRLTKSNPDRASIPFVFVTVVTEVATRALAVHAGASGYVTKPFSPMSLISRVNALCDERPYVLLSERRQA